MSDTDPTSLQPTAEPETGELALPANADSEERAWHLRMFRSLRHRNYRLFFFGQLVSLMGTWMQNVAQSWLVWELSHSSVWLGIIGFMTFVPQLLFSMIGGIAADRYPKRTLIIVTQSASMLLAFVLATLVLTHTATVWIVAGMAFLLGTVNSFDMPARQTFVTEMVGKEDVTNAVGLNSAVFNTARLVGPAIGGWVIYAVGTGWCFFFNGVSFLAVILGLLAMRVEPRGIVHTGKSVLRSLREGLIFIRGERTILAFMIMVSTLTVFGWSYSVLLPLFADNILHVGAVGLGNLLSANGVGALTSALLVATLGERIPPRRLVTIAVVVFLCGVTTLALSHSFVLTLIALVFIGMGLTSFFTTANSMFQRRSPDALRGRVLGVYSMVFGGFYPFGSLEVGTLAKVIGPGEVILINAAICLVIGAIVIRMIDSGVRRSSDEAVGAAG